VGEDDALRFVLSSRGDGTINNNNMVDCHENLFFFRDVRNNKNTKMLLTHFEHISNTFPTHFEHISNTFRTHFEHTLIIIMGSSYIVNDLLSLVANHVSMYGHPY
jgi:hypothetical protein